MILQKVKSLDVVLKSRISILARQSSCEIRSRANIEWNDYGSSHSDSASHNPTESLSFPVRTSLTATKCPISGRLPLLFGLFFMIPISVRFAFELRRPRIPKNKSEFSRFLLTKSAPSQNFFINNGNFGIFQQQLRTGFELALFLSLETFKLFETERFIRLAQRVGHSARSLTGATQCSHRQSARFCRFSLPL